ncbi:MAG: PTS sugar transporter subunit IIA [Thermoanaerobaculia bacterium]
MRLTVNEAATLLDASSERIYQWIESGDLPASRVNEQFRINRTELLEWATLRDIAVGPAVFHDTGDEAGAPGLADALAGGGVISGITGTTRPEVLRAVVSHLELTSEERAMLLHLLVARDKTAFVSLHDGVAIPHVRHPIVLAAQPRLYLFYLHDEIEFIGIPVRWLFVLLTPTIRAHLQILAKLSYVLRDPTFRRAIGRRDEDVRAMIKAVEAQLA